jgi:hypothetical protein
MKSCLFSREESRLFVSFIVVYVALLNLFELFFNLNFFNGSILKNLGKNTVQMQIRVQRT